MKPSRGGDGERILAVFIDFENLALGFGNRRDRFSIEKVLERLVEKGKIVAKKAYADWSRFGFYTSSLHEAAVELTEIPKRMLTGKNSADIRMCVDAMDLAYSKEHIDTFVVVSGDSDFSPLVSKLKELGKHVIGLGLADSTSDLLRDNCDEFIYYEDLDRAPMIPLEEDQSIPENKRKVFALLLDSLLALRRENKELIFSSMVKDTMKRKKPSFNEEYHGYRTFSELLEDAQKHGIVDIDKHKTSGTYVVVRFGSEPRLPANMTAALPPSRPLALPAPVNSGRSQSQSNNSQRSAPAEPTRTPHPPVPTTALPKPAQPAAPPTTQPDRDRDRDRGGRGRNERNDRNDRRPEPEPQPQAVAPPPRRIVTLPPKPIVMPPAASTPLPPSPVPASLSKRPAPVDDADDDRLPLGRALIEDVEIFDDDDDLDEVPSYMPRKLKTPLPGAKPAGVKPAEKPKAVEKPAEKPKVVEKPAARQQKVVKAEAPPAAAAPAAKKQAATRTKAPKADESAEAKPVKKVAAPKAETPAPAPVKPAQAVRPVAPPPTPAPARPVTPPPAEDDGFGAGLDL